MRTISTDAAYAPFIDIHVQRFLAQNIMPYLKDPDAKKCAELLSNPPTLSIDFVRTIDNVYTTFLFIRDKQQDPLQQYENFFKLLYLAFVIAGVIPEDDKGAAA